MRILILLSLMIITNSLEFKKPITNNNIDHVKLANMVKDSLSHVHEKVSPHLESIATKNVNKLKATTINSIYNIPDRTNDQDNLEVGGDIYIKSNGNFGDDSGIPYTFYTKIGVDYIEDSSSEYQLTPYNGEYSFTYIKGETNFHVDFSIDGEEDDGEEDDEKDPLAWTVKDLYISTVFNVNVFDPCENLIEDQRDNCDTTIDDEIKAFNNGLTIVSFLNVGPRASDFDLFYNEQLLREFLQNINPDIDVSIRQSASR